MLGGRVRVLGTDRMFLVHGHVIGKEGPLGEEEPWHRLAGDVYETGHPEPDRRLQSIEGRHEVVLEHDVRRVAGRLGDRRSVHDRLGATHDGEGVACIRSGRPGRSPPRLPRAARRPAAVRSVARTSWPASWSAATVALPTLPRAPVTSTRIYPPGLASGRWYTIPIPAFHPSGSRVKALHENRRRRGDRQHRDQRAPVARRGRKRRVRPRDWRAGCLILRCRRSSGPRRMWSMTILSLTLGAPTLWYSSPGSSSPPATSPNSGW